MCLSTESVKHGKFVVLVSKAKLVEVATAYKDSESVQPSNRDALSPLHWDDPALQSQLLWNGSSSRSCRSLKQVSTPSVNETAACHRNHDCNYDTDNYPHGGVANAYTTIISHKGFKHVVNTQNYQPSIIALTSQLLSNTQPY